ncbi:MAG: 50S ribosomal protein L25 [Dehalococcoidia bacterium]|nr:50S ribosomal protein L25 [Dehalococcoidia bacterium]MQG15459.1 50S ribosomal protein L25 [SAR202 cluster bacterium]|tara:strand:+ start:9694 stop:10422 length:729 start_codon:yes stop_codon:yes gene_type:complete
MGNKLEGPVMTSLSNTSSIKDTAEIKLSNRSISGKKVANLRKDGIMPVHLYGGDGGPLSLQGDSAEINRLLPRVGLNIPVTVIVDNSESGEICFVREVQRHPLTQDILHVDFLRVDVKSKITASVPIEVVGDSPAVRLLGGTLIQNMQSINVEALPLSVPEKITVDITSIEDFESAIHISDISVEGDISITNPPDALVARVAPPRIELEPVSDEAPEEAVGEIEGEQQDSETDGDQQESEEN